VDRTRRTDAPLSFHNPDDARAWLPTVYRRDRTEGQLRQVILGVEKDTLVEQVSAWFDREGLPVVVLRGYASQSYLDDVADLIAADPRPTTLIYAGDFDPSGEDIVRDFRERVAGIDEFVKGAVTPEVIERFDLPERPGKETDSRAAGFRARHGRLVQVEVEALAPADLSALFRAAVDPLVDTSALDAVISKEEAERRELKEGLD
jgi:hypothetical protein